MTTTLETDTGNHHLDGDIAYPAALIGDDLDAARGWAAWVGDALLAWSKNPATDDEKRPTDDVPNFVSQAFVKLGIGLAEVYTHIADVEVRRAEHGAKNAWRAEQQRARAISEGLASASVNDDPPVDQTRLDFPLVAAEEAEQDEATG